MQVFTAAARSSVTNIFVGIALIMTRVFFLLLSARAPGPDKMGHSNVREFGDSERYRERAKGGPRY